MAIQKLAVASYITLTIKDKMEEITLIVDDIVTPSAAPLVEDEEKDEVKDGESTE